MNKTIVKEIPFYCKECGKCETAKETEDNLRIKNNTGWTHDIYCMKQKQIVYRM